MTDTSKSPTSQNAQRFEIRCKSGTKLLEATAGTFYNASTICDALNKRDRGVLSYELVDTHNCGDPNCIALTTTYECTTNVETKGEAGARRLQLDADKRAEIDSSISFARLSSRVAATQLDTDREAIAQAIAVARMELPEDTHPDDIADAVVQQIGFAIFDRNEAFIVTSIATAMNS
jgi:hypothetical protein